MQNQTPSTTEALPEGQDGRIADPVLPVLPLGVGAIIGESFSILFRNFFKIFIAGFVPSLLGYLIPVSLLASFDLLTLQQLFLQQPEQASGAAALAGGFWALVQIVVFAVTAALLVQLAYDAKLGRPVMLRRYIGPALLAVLPIAILGGAIAVLLFVATTALFLGAGLLGPVAVIAIPVTPVLILWILAVFIVTAPAIVIERVGFRGLGRSAQLTRDYRWPIVGAIVLTFLCYLLINILVGGVIMLVLFGLVSMVPPTGFIGVIAGGILPVVFTAALFTIGFGLVGVFVALIYARLREIKEGIGVDQIAAVFE